MNLSSFHGRWFAAQVKTHREQTVGRLISVKGYEVFIPLYDDRKRKRQSPLFPGYLFLRYDNSLPDRVLTTPGLIRLLGVGRSPVPIEDYEIESVGAICRSGLRVSPLPFAKVGERVEITEGPLMGVRGRVVEYRNRCRLIVSIDLLQRSVFADVDVAQMSIVKSL